MKPDAYPPFCIDNSLDALTGRVYFSMLDSLSGYWHVRLHQNALEKAAFAMRGELLTWKLLPFGLTSAPAAFEQFTSVKIVVTSPQKWTGLFY